MADLALVDESGRLERGTTAARQVRDKLREALEWRRQYEPGWQLNLAFASGQHWNVLQENRLLRRIDELDDAYAGRELYVADKINEYRHLALGELGSNDDRLELLLASEDEQGEDFQEQVNRALGYGWDYEFDADEALAEADRLCVDLGVSAVRVRWEPHVGPVKYQQVPHMDGKPILSEDDAVKAVAAAAGEGKTLEFKDVQEGRISWEPLSSFNLLTPPGVTHERYFPWEAVRRPVLLATVKGDYGEAAEGLQEDKDIGSTLGKAVDSGTPDYVTSVGNVRQTRLAGHVWLTTYYERPCPQYPNGRVLHFGGSDMTLLRSEDQLPFARLNENGEPVDWHSGISYFHWSRVTGRWHSRGLVEAVKDPQWFINKLGMQINETIDKGQPWVAVPTGPMEQDLKQTTTPLEIVPYTPGQGQPTIHQGIGPGPWMQEHRDRLLQDMEHAAGIRSPSLGENPENVDTYSALARLMEADHVKRSVQQRERKLAIRQLIENTVYLIRDYWGPEKHLAIAGDDNRLEVHNFDATRIPPNFVVHIAKGDAKPRSQAAELKKIEDIWAAAVTSGAVALRPDVWVKWLKESMDAGEAQELPENPSDVHAEKALMENQLILDGQQLVPAEYDPAEVHLPIHRAEQVQCELVDDAAGWERLQDHVESHLLVQQEMLRRMALDQAGLPAAVAPPPEENEETGVQPA